MFDLGYQEMAVIVALAVIILKPEEVPGVLRSVGRFVGFARRAGEDILRELRASAVAVDKSPSGPDDGKRR